MVWDAATIRAAAPKDERALPAESTGPPAMTPD